MEQPNRKLITSKEAAEFLSYWLSWFRKLIMRRIIPMYNSGGSRRIFRELEQ